MKVFKILIVTFIFIFQILAVYEVSAGDCIEAFSWKPNTEPNVAKYKIYYGTVDGVYPNVTDVGKPEPIDGRCNGTVTGLDCGQTYYFVCVAANFYGKESLYSQQVIVTTSSLVPGPPTSLNIIE